ncbi:MAG: hypothetical protein RBT19_04635 [Tenuifilaceae bacterium]|nr:hypothetical protein [Tenuifilaceae bacterium]
MKHGCFDRLSIGGTDLMPTCRQAIAVKLSIISMYLKSSISLLTPS